MGRSPFFQKYIKPIPLKKILITEEYREQDRVVFQHVSGQKQYTTLSKPRLERHCSTYGMHEIYLPDEDDIYILTLCETICFENGSENETYIIWHVEKEGPKNKYLCTWVLRNDGFILNAEDLSFRGEIGSIKRLAMNSSALPIA